MIRSGESAPNTWAICFVDRRFSCRVTGTSFQRDASLAREDALRVVHEDVQTAGVLVAQAAQQRRPPEVAEVLRLVDHDRVEEVGRAACVGERAERERQPPLPVVRVVVGAGIRPPGQRQVVEETDVGGTVACRPLLDDPLEVATESARVAQEGDPLAGSRSPSRLFESEPRLATPRAAHDAHPVHLRERVERAGLVAGHLLEPRLVLRRERQVLRLAGKAPGERLDEVGDVVEGERRVPLAVALDRVLDAVGHAERPLQVRAVDEHVSRQVERRPVGRHVPVRQSDEVRGARPAGPEAATTQQRLERVPGPLHLTDRVDAVPTVAAALVPRALVPVDVTALDLDRRDPDSRPRDEHVDLVLVLVLLEVQAVDDDRVVRQLRDERLPHGTLCAAVVGKRRVGGIRVRHDPFVPHRPDDVTGAGGTVRHPHQISPAVAEATTLAGCTARTHAR